MNDEAERYEYRVGGTPDGFGPWKRYGNLTVDEHRYLAAAAAADPEGYAEH